MKEIIVDGVTYVPKETSGDIKICVLDRGFTYVGTVEIIGSLVRIVNARCLIRWGTTSHLGELKNGPLANTKLGAVCNVTVPMSSLVHMVDVSEEKWKL